MQILIFSIFLRHPVTIFHSNCPLIRHSIESVPTCIVLIVFYLYVCSLKKLTIFHIWCELKLFKVMNPLITDLEWAWDSCKINHSKSKSITRTNFQKNLEVGLKTQKVGNRWFRVSEILLTNLKLFIFKLISSQGTL